MDYSKSAFIDMALSCNALRFGEFTLKSGRKSPYFFNAGLFYQGENLRHIGRFYANTIIDNHLIFDHLFGPAYKGLPLATATAIALAEKGFSCTVTFNRKEIKDHGERGYLIGAPLTGKTVVIDDVISAGTAFREAHNLIKQEGGNLSTVVIALDRCEQGITKKSALEEIQALGIEVLSIITLFDLINYLQEKKQDKKIKLLQEYLKHYGCH